MKFNINLDKRTLNGIKHHESVILDFVNYASKAEFASTSEVRVANGFSFEVEIDWNLKAQLRLLRTKGLNKWFREAVSAGSLPVWAMNCVDLQGCDLEDANLSGMELQGANLEQAKLVRTKLKYAQLPDANLSKADLSYADLENADLRGANLSGAYLTGAYLNGANLTGANLKGVITNATRLNRANLDMANLRGANLTGVISLGKADLMGAVYDDKTVWPDGFSPLSAMKYKQGE